MSEKIKKLLNNKYFIVALVALLIVLVIGTGTYAWLTWSSPNTTKLTVKIGNIADVIFDNGKEINTTSLAPVFTYDQGEKTSFSIVKRSTATSANIDYTITLNITSIAAELKVASFKYVLLNGNQVVRQGDFSSASSGDAISLSSSKLTDTRADFTFYIYIDGNTENNANMMNKEFKATINVSASEGSNTINAVQHITNLYLNNKDYTMQNGDVVYSIASSENLMMDKNGGITEEEDSGNLRYYGEYPKNYIFFNCDAYPDTNCEIWRIIGVFNGKLKISRDEPISTTAVPMDLAGATYWKNTTIGKIFNYNEQSCSLYWSNSFTESCSVAESVLSLDSNFIYDIGTENTLKNNETKSMMDTDKNAFLKEHGCCFYLSNDGKTQLCAVDSEQWKDAFVAILTDELVCMRHAETNEFKGERTNRQVWSEIKHLNRYGNCQVSEIAVENANAMLKEYVFDYINNH